MLVDRQYILPCQTALTRVYSGETPASLYFASSRVAAPSMPARRSRSWWVLREGFSPGFDSRHQNCLLGAVRRQPDAFIPLLTLPTFSPSPGCWTPLHRHPTPHRVLCQCHCAATARVPQCRPALGSVQTSVAAWRPPAMARVSRRRCATRPRPRRAGCCSSGASFFTGMGCSCCTKRVASWSWRGPS